MNDVSAELEAWMEERHNPGFIPTKIRWPRWYTKR